MADQPNTENLDKALTRKLGTFGGVFTPSVLTILGIILFLCTSKSSVPLAAIALGLMFLVSGIAVFAADVEKIKNFVSAYSEMPGLVIRLLGLVAAAFGILIFSIF